MLVFANQSISKNRAKVIDLLNELQVFFPARKNLAQWDVRNKGLLLDILNELETTSSSLSMQEFVASVRAIKVDVQNLPVDPHGERKARLSYLKLKLRGLRVELGKAICNGPSKRSGGIREPQRQRAENL